MKSTGIRRKVDDLGRVVIPAGIRRTLDMREGDAVEVAVDGDNVILFKPSDRCVFCGAEEEPLHGFRGRRVCRACVASVGVLDEQLRRTPAPQQPDAPRPVADLPAWDSPAAARSRVPEPAHASVRRLPDDARQPEERRAYESASTTAW